MREALDNIDENLTTWDEKIIRSLIHTIKVLAKDKILIMFHDGIEREQKF